MTNEPSDVVGAIVQDNPAVILSVVLGHLGHGELGQWDLGVLGNFDLGTRGYTGTGGHAVVFVEGSGIDGAGCCGWGSSNDKIIPRSMMENTSWPTTDTASPAMVPRQAAATVELVLRIQYVVASQTDVSRAERTEDGASSSH